MKKRFALVAVCAAAVCAMACSGGTTTPSPTPTPPSGQTRIIALSGTLAFGNVAVGQKATANFTISNSGNSVLTITGMNLPDAIVGDFLSTFTKGTIAAGASQPVTVTLTPTAARSYNATLTVTGDQTSGSNTIAITGTSTLSPDQPLTVSAVAAPLAHAFASAVTAALEGPMQSGGAFVATSSSGGSVRIAPVTVTSGHYDLSAATATFTSWQFSAGTKTASMSGSVGGGLGSVWCPGQGSCSGLGVAQPTMPATFTGGLLVTPDVGSVSVGAGSAIGLNGYAVSIGGAGLQTGAPDTPPPPNPNTCLASLSQTSFNPGASGGSVTVTVTVAANCSWTASSAGFISATGSGRGPGTAVVSVGANTGAARVGSVTIAGVGFTVNQAAGTTSGGPFDGTYDMTISYNVNLGPTQTITRYLVITNGNARSTDGEITGSVTASGSATMHSACPENETLTATWQGTFSAATGTSGKSAKGTRTCSGLPNSYAWSASNGR